MAARRDPQEHLKELRAAISADLTELGRRWRSAREDASDRGRNLAATAAFVAELVRRPRQSRAADRPAGE